MSGQVFQIELPDGRVVGIQASSPEEAAKGAKNVMMREKGEAKGKQGGVDNFMRSVARGQSFGLADETAAGGDALFGPLVDKFTKSGTSDAPTIGERYDQNLETERGQDKAYDDQFPGWSTTGKVVGGVTGALSMVPRFLLSGAQGLPGLAKTIGAGIGLGGLGGFGEGEGGFEERAKSAGKGAAVGGAVGGVLHPVAAGAGALVNGIVESPFGRTVADKVVAPGMRLAADAFDAVAPKVGMRSLSAAAPEGGMSPTGPLSDMADHIRFSAPSGEGILEDAAAKRIADAARRGGTDIPGMRARVDELGPGAMLADTDPMVQRLGRTAYTAPGSAPKIINEAMDARNRGTSQRMIGAIDEATGNSGPAVLEAEKLAGQRLGQGTKNYAEAVGPDAPYTISPEMRTIMQETPAIREVMDRIEKEAAQYGVTLTPAQVAHRVKRQLAQDADAAFSSGKAVNKEDVGSLGERWRTALHDANPAIKKADEVYQAGSKQIDALALGRTFMKQGTGEAADAVSPAIMARKIEGMSAEEAQAFIAGAADTMKQQAGSGARQARQLAGQLDENGNLRTKLEAMLGKENASKLFNRAMGEKTFAGTDKTIRGGSDTASKMLSAMDDAASGSIPTSPHSLVARLISGVGDAYNKQKAGNEAVRGRIAKMLTETDASVNSETIDRIAAILAQQARRPRAIRGAAGGAGQIQE
jgi:hypothetical protein